MHCTILCRRPSSRALPDPKWAVCGFWGPPPSQYWGILSKRDHRLILCTSLAEEQEFCTITMSSQLEDWWTLPTTPHQDCIWAKLSCKIQRFLSFTILKLNTADSVQVMSTVSSACSRPHHSLRLHVIEYACAKKLTIIMSVCSSTPASSSAKKCWKCSCNCSYSCSWGAR